ncbi:MAG TPA: hypothetical protein VKS81_01180 [Bacteroidota bacterium]|nr:hypothetical protein [Bacteroidota bacterium]
MKTSLWTAVVAVLIVAATGCDNRSDELQKENSALQSKNTSLTTELSERDEYVNNITDSINAAYVSIENLKTNEGLLQADTKGMESSKNLSSEEVRAQMSERLGAIRAMLLDDHKRLRNLQARLSTSKKEYAGIKLLVDNLNKTLAERDQSINELTNRVSGLEQDVSAKTALLTQKDSVITDQHTEITTAFYVCGTRDELENKGVIRNEGGFPWGLFGTTTTIMSGFDQSNFKPIDNSTTQTIQVNGTIDEIIPKRNVQYYSLATFDGNTTRLFISNPQMFWKEKYLVIITNNPSTATNVSGLIQMVH